MVHIKQGIGSFSHFSYRCLLDATTEDGVNFKTKNKIVIIEILRHN